MRFMLLLVIIAMLGFASQAQTPATQSAAEDNAPAGNAESGKKLYAQYGCYQCHGYAAHGGTGPRLAPRPSPYPAFSKYVRQPTGEMPPYTAKVVTDTQLADIYSFLRTIPQPPPVDSIPLLKDN